MVTKIQFPINFWKIEVTKENRMKIFVEDTEVLEIIDKIGETRRCHIPWGAVHTRNL